MSYLFTLVCFVVLIIMFNKMQNKIESLTFLVEQMSQKTNKNKIVKPDVPLSPWGDEQLEKMDKQLKEKAAETDAPIFSLEKLFLGNLFSKIGAVALIIGIGIFVRLISPYLQVNPAVRITLGYVVGAAIFAFGHYLYKKDAKFKNYAEVLFGTGIGIYFVVTFCAVGLYQLFSLTTALIAANVILIAAFFISSHYRSFSSFLVALAGCYLSPCFMNDFYSMNVLFVYVLFINIMSVIYVWHNPQRVLLNVVSLIVSVFLIIHFNGHNAEAYSVFMPLLFWSLYTCSDFINLHHIEDKKALYLTQVSVFLNFAAFILLLQSMHLDLQSIGNYTLYPLVLYGAFGVLPKPEKLHFFIHPFLLSVGFCTYCFFADANLIVAWSVEGLLAIIIATRLKTSELLWWGGVFASLAFVYVFSLNEIFGDFNKPLLLFINMRAIVLLLPAAINFVSVAVISRQKFEFSPIIAQTLRLYAWGAVYLYLGVELNQWLFANMNNVNPQQDWTYEFSQRMFYALLGFIFAGHLAKLFYSTDFKPFMVVSAMAYFGALILIIFFGCKFTPLAFYWPLANVRMLAFIAAIVCSVCFYRWNKNQFFIYVAILLGFLCINYELSDVFIKFSGLTNQAVITSIIWLIYAGLLIFSGISHRAVSLKNSGILIAILALGKILIFDMWNVEALYKVIAFIVMGIVLLSVSYYYARRSRE